MALTLRLIKGSELTYSEMDANLSGLADGSNMAPTFSLPGLLDVSAAGQIRFPGTQNASSNVNTLDDYEEGTWTPALAIPRDATYSNQVGTYVKIGKLVYIEGILTINTIGNGDTGPMGGLPFTCAVLGPGRRQAITVSEFSNLAVNTVYLVGWVANDSTLVEFNGMASAGGSIDQRLGIFGDRTDIRFSGVYLSAD